MPITHCMIPADQSPSRKQLKMAEFWSNLLFGLTTALLLAPLLRFIGPRVYNLQKPATNDRVLCFVMTTSVNRDRGQAVASSWGKRCDKLVFFISSDDVIPDGTNLTYIQLDFPGGEQGRERSSPKLRASLLYIYEHFFQDYDWFFKAYDDTYVIVDNLRQFLSKKNPHDPGYYGQKLDLYIVDTKQSFNSGGAGYVLSKETIRRFAKFHKAYPHQCITSGPEDYEISRCLEKLEVLPAEDTRDSFGKTRFHPYDFRTHMTGKYDVWYKKYNKVGAKLYGPDGISDQPISFNHMAPTAMKELEFYVYHLKPHSVIKPKVEIIFLP